MNNKKGKKILYLMVMIALSMIQFIRATQYDGIALPAVNCTGVLILLLIISQIGVRNLINKISCVYTAACFCVAILLKLFGNYEPDPYKRVLSIMLNAWLIGIVLVYYYKEVYTNKSIKVQVGIKSVLWYLFTILVVVGNSGKFWPVWFFIVFGLFYITPFEKKDFELLFKSMIDGIIISFFIIQSYAFLFRPYDIVRYSGSFTNCNDMALFYQIVYVAILAKLHVLHCEETKKVTKAFFFLMASAILAFQFMTGCRTVWASSVTITLIFACLVMKRKWGDSWRKLLEKGLGLVVCFIVMVPIVYLSIRYLPTIHPHPVWFMDDYSEERVHSWDSRDSEKYVSFEEMLNTNIGRVLEVFKIYLENSPLAIQSYASSIQGEKTYIEYWDEVEKVLGHNSFTARLAFARGYLHYSTWLGHKDSDYIFFQRTFPGHDDQIYHSQNLWVQAIYNYGYLAGAIVFVLSITVLLTQFKNIKESDNEYYVFSLLITLVFFLHGILESVWVPGTLILTLVFVVQKRIPSTVLEK